MTLSKSLKFTGYALGFGILAFLILSIPTAVIRNHFFFRMTPTYWFDYIFLVVNSVLIGLYFASTYTSSKPEACVVEKKSMFAQGLAFLGIACPICNKLLVYIFSATFLMTFLEPIRPYISLASAILLLWLVARKIKYVEFKTA